jgi:hypothetical protein
MFLVCNVINASSLIYFVNGGTDLNKKVSGKNANTTLSFLYFLSRYDDHDGSLFTT